MLRFPRHLILLSGLVVFGFASGQEPPDGRRKADPPKTINDEATSAEGVAYFEKKIRPVLVAECYECHSTEKGKKAKGGLSLDTREGTRKGSESGPAIVVGKPAQSLLIKALGHGDPKSAMPPKKKLDAAVVRDFDEWVRIGAPDPRDGAAASS